MKGRRLVTLLLLAVFAFLFLLPAAPLNLGAVNRAFAYGRVASAPGAKDSLSQCISGGEYLNYSVLTTGYSSPPPSGDFSLPPPEAQSVNLTFNDTFDGWFLIEVRRNGSTSFYAINNYSREVGDIGGCGGMSLSPPESPSDIVLEAGCYSPFVFSNALAAGGRFRITLPFVDHESPHVYGEVVGTTTVSLWNGTDNEYYAVWKLSVNFANSTVVVGGAFYLEVNTGIMLIGFYSEGKVTSEEGYVFRNSQYRLRLEDSNVQKLRSQRLPVITGVFNLTEDYQSRDLDGCWLKYRTEGYLTLKEQPSEPVRMTMDMVDWSRTKAWGEGGYYSRIFMNVEGREPQGVIPQEKYDEERETLLEKLRGITDEKGESIGTVVYHPERIYEKIVNIPPDLIVHLGNLDWRSAGSVGVGSVHMFENDTGPDDANHAQEGIFISSMRLREPVAQKSPYSIFDIAPTVLDYFGIEVPRDMIGESLLTDGQWLTRQPRELAEGLRKITEAGKRDYSDVPGWGSDFPRSG